MGIRFIVNILEKFGFDFSFQAAQPEAPAATGTMYASSAQPARKHFPRLAIDLPLLLVVLGLVGFGLMMMFSASSDFSYRLYRDPMYSFRRQIQWAVLGLGGCFVLALLRYQVWKKLALPATLVTLALLLGVLAANDERLGATRSLAGGSYQPSELAKLMTVIYVSAWLSSNRGSFAGNQWFNLLRVGAILGIIGAFIAMQPDLSALLTVIILGMLVYFLGGGPLPQFLLLAGVAAFTAFMVSTTDIYLTGRLRIESFLAGLGNLMQSSDHVKRSLEAFVRGGWVGVGIGQSQIKLLGLPFPHTDSIFAVIGEETGVLGALLLVCAYLFILYRGLQIARRAPDEFGRLLAAGLTFWLFFEAALNMSVLIGLLPFAGNALPFISAGGSSMVFSLAAVGILLNLSRQVESQPQTEVVGERGLYAFTNLRRWNGRGRVSRPGRSTGASNSE